MLPIIASIVSGLIQNNMHKVADAVMDKGVDYVQDKLGIQLNAGTPQTIQAWKQTYSWLVGRQMTRCADGLVVQACQLKGANGNITLLWTKGPEVSVDVTGLGSTVQYLDGTSLPIGSSKTIGLGIAPVAVS